MILSPSLALLLLAQPVDDGAAAAPVAERPAAPARDTWAAQDVPEPLTDEEACAMFQDRAQRLAPDLPLRVTYGQYRLRSAVDCAARSYRVEDEVTIAPADLGAGWQAIEQDRWTSEYCGNLVTLPLLWRGWRFVQQVSFQDGRKLEFVPECERHAPQKHEAR